MDERPRKTIDGTKTNSLPVAYCYYKRHKGCLTLKQLKNHKCLRKKCPLLIKYPNDFWDRREKIKREKRERKHESTR